MRLPRWAASASSTRRAVSPTGPDSGRISCAPAADKKRPQQSAAARTAVVKARSTRADPAQARRVVVGRRALDVLEDQLLLAAQAHRDVAARLQVVVHFQRAEERRDVVPDLVVLLGIAPELAAPVVLVHGEDLPAVLVDVEAALGVDVARA